MSSSPYRGLLAALALLLAVVPCMAAELPKAVQKRVDAARADAAKELFRLGTFCARKKAYDDARAAWRVCVIVEPGNTKAPAKAAKIEDKLPKPSATYAAAYDEKRGIAYEKCTKLLAAAAQFCWEQNQADAFDELCGLVIDHFPSEKIRERLNLVYFKGYAKFVHSDAYKRLRKGDEFVDGRWRTSEEMKKLNAKHATWATRWQIDDGIHRIETNMSLRTARQVMHTITSFRKWYLHEFGDEWPLKPPPRLLPVLVTRTQKEYAMVCKLDGTNPPEGAAAFYMPRTHKCYVTFQPGMQGGGASAVGFEHVAGTLRHELVHQIGYEYSRFAGSGPGNSFGHFASEGIAEFASQYTLRRDGQWRLWKPREIGISLHGGSAGPIYWVKSNFRHLPDLSELLACKRAKFKVREYHWACTFTYFMLEGAERRYRKGYLQVLREVHRYQANKTTWGRAFPDKDLAELAAEFEAFTKKIKIDR